jgi:peptide/nickel transport system permease protein
MKKFIANSEPVDSIDKKTDNKKELSPLKIALKRLRKNKLASLGLVIICIITLLSVLGPMFTTYGRDSIDTTISYQAPSIKHWLGTDELGRDSFTRLLHGGRVSLSVGLVSTGISVLIGVLLGAMGGYFGGKADIVIMRIVDIFMCFPFFLIAIVTAAILGPSIWNVMIISGILSWTSIARIVRAEVLSLKHREFIEAARALGLNSKDIITGHILPNIIAPIIVYATLGIASGIIAEAGLSYLGLGVKPPASSWGNMLSAAQNMRSLRMHWWLWIPPGFMVLLTVLSINFLGDGLRDALDPKLKQQEE